MRVCVCVFSYSFFINSVPNSHSKWGPTILRDCLRIKTWFLRLWLGLGLGLDLGLEAKEKHYVFKCPHKDKNARMGNLQLYVKSMRKSEWFKCKLVNNAKRGPPHIVQHRGAARRLLWRRSYILFYLQGQK